MSADLSQGWDENRQQQGDDKDDDEQFDDSDPPAPNRPPLRFAALGRDFLASLSRPSAINPILTL